MRNFKKRWLAIPLAAGVLGLALTGTVILAHGGGPGGLRANDTAARLAEILQLEEAQVQAAFDQMHRENEDQRLQAMLDRLVAAERIDPELAQQVMVWYQARPESTIHLAPALFLGEDALQRHLDRLVAHAVITEDEAQEVRNWYDTRPEGFDEIQIGKRGHRGPQGRWHQDFRGGHSPFQDGTSGFPEGLRESGRAMPEGQPF